MTICEKSISLNANNIFINARRCASAMLWLCLCVCHESQLRYDTIRDVILTCARKPT